MVAVGIIVAWLLVGAVVGLVEARRGHWHKSWVPSAFFGPLAIPLALRARQRESAAGPVVVGIGEHRAEGLKVLVGVDGSSASTSAAGTVARLLGSRLSAITLAAVVDFDTALPAYDDAVVPEGGWPERAEAEAALDAAAAEIEFLSGLRPTTLILAGDPATALVGHAVEEGHDLLAVGTRGRGMTEYAFGSCASALARRQKGIAVLLVPPDAEDETPALRD